MGAVSRLTHTEKSALAVYSNLGFWGRRRVRGTRAGGVGEWGGKTYLSMPKRSS